MTFDARCYAVTVARHDLDTSISGVRCLATFRDLIIPDPARAPVSGMVRRILNRPVLYEIFNSHY